MSGTIPSPFLSPQELLAPREHNRLMRQTDAYVASQAMAERKQEAELELSDQAQIANTAGYLLSLPTEEARAAAWGKIHPSLPGHVQSRAPSVYQGEDWLRAVQARAIPAVEMWKDQQTQAANRALLGGAPAGAAAGTSAGTSGSTAAYGTGGPGASATVPPELMPHFQAASAATGVPVDKLIAQARQESTLGRLSPNIMQITDETARNPGFGMTGVDPAALREPAANIMFGARYLKARMGAGDPNDPAVWERGLADYNGGGDPNYVRNVTRYLPAQGGVAGRTGGVDVAGPGAGSDPGGGMPPDVRSRVMSMAGSQPNALTAPPGAVPPQGGEPPPMSAPVAAASPAQIAAQLGIGPDGLTARDKQVLAANARSPTAQLSTLMEGMVTRNRAQVQQTYEQQREAAKDARQAEVDRIEVPLKKANLDKAQREAAQAAQTEREPLFQGKGDDGQDFHILRYSDPKTPEYHQAYARQANPKVGEGGLVVYPNMAAYKLPLDEDGQPITTLDQPKLTIGPGSLAEIRKLETQASSLISSLDDFAATAKRAGPGEMLKTALGQPTDLRSAWTNAALQAKGEALYNLGVLSGPDMSVIRGALADPSTFWGATASNDTIDKQVSRIKRLLETRIDQARRSYGGGMSPSGSAGASPAPAAAPAADTGPIRVTGAEDYARVPSGGTYTDPDGNTRRKP